MSAPIVPVILSGGAGTRLWPISREAHPKPFMRVNDGESLLQKTFLRAIEILNIAEILTVTNREVFFKTENEFQAIAPQSVRTSFLLEPVGRNTAPAIAIAATYLSKIYGPDVMMLVMPADHLIANVSAFTHAVAEAQKLAQQNLLVTFGARPDRPETGFGYIEVDDSKNMTPQVLRFVEKPNNILAKQYLASGNYLWNVGIFCFAAKTVLAELNHFMPELVTQAEACLNASLDKAKDNLSAITLNESLFTKLPDISIDYALLEKSKNVGVVACDLGWTDVGSWSAVSQLNTADEQGNTMIGEVYAHDAENCYVQSQDRITSVVGVKDLVVVDTPDALLVSHRDRTQDVKHIVQQLKNNNHEAYKLHRTVYRPWGSYTILEQGQFFKVKRIEVKPKASLSLQMHYHRSEHWIVVRGTAKVTNGDLEFILNANQSTFITAGSRHRLENPGAIDLVMIEVQTGEYLGEDDIVRFQDSYGRV